MADLRSQYGIGSGDIAYHPGSSTSTTTSTTTTPSTTTTTPDYGSALIPDYYKNIKSALSGELPEDVKNLIGTAAAEYGIMTGMPGSQLAGYAGLRNLGLTSLARSDWAAKMLQPNVLSELDLKKLTTQSELDQANWMARYEAQLAEKRREDYLKNKGLGGGTPPIVTTHAPPPSSITPGGGYNPNMYNPSGYRYGLGLGTFGTPPPTSNMAVMKSIMDEYGPQTSSNYGTQTDYGMPASSAANYAALAGGTAAGLMGGFGPLGAMASLFGATQGMEGAQSPYQGPAGGWGDPEAYYWIPQE